MLQKNRKFGSVHTNDINKSSSLFRNKPWLITLLSVMAWLLFLGLPFLMRPGSRHPEIPQKRIFDENAGMILHMMINAMLIPLFYFQITVVYPRTLGRKRILLFAGVQLLLITLVIAVSRAFTYIVFADSMRGVPYMFIIMNYLFIMMIAYSYIFVTDNLARERREKEQENATLQAELTFLRWQISPHFLFNSLNNLVALARKRSDELEPMLIQLSTLMRYMLYETDERKVTLGNEAAYLKSYIELQSLRFGSEITIKQDIQLAEANMPAIEPMLLIPFVENAFKHGTGIITAPEIIIRLAYKEDTLYFTVSNKYQANGGSKDSSGGIGLSNVQRRLNLLYPDNHFLGIEIADGWYTATLNIHLS